MYKGELFTSLKPISAMKRLLQFQPLDQGGFYEKKQVQAKIILRELIIW